MSFFLNHKSCWLITRLFTIIIISALAIPTISAREKINVLLINSYSDNSPWSNAVIYPINNIMIKTDSAHCEVENLNSIMIDDINTYNTRVNRLFEKHKDHHPHLVIMVDGMAFTLRDRIREKWGDIPILMIGRTNKVAPVEYYFSGFEGSTDWDTMGQLRDIQNKYNMTFIEYPNNYRQTIDLMLSLFPDMQELMFMSDGIYFNRILSREIKDYLEKAHNKVHFNWIKVSESTIHEYENLLKQPQSKTGMLLSTWSYKITNEFGTPAMVSEESTLILSTPNPIFSLREPYIKFGSIGGVYNDPQEYSQILESTISKIFSGVAPRDIPFQYLDRTQTVLNYPLLDTYNINPNQTPSNTIFVEKPKSIFDKYKWQILLISALVFIMFVVLVIYIFYQGRYVKSLRSHDSLIKNLPMPYAKAFVHYDAQGNIENIEYDPHHDNKYFVDLLKSNAINGQIRHLFKPSELASTMKELTSTGGPVTFDYYFPVTDTYYLFSICLVKNQGKAIKSNDNKLIEIDIFAHDITPIRRVDKELKRTAASLDMTLQVATIVPWYWDLEKRIFNWNSKFIKYDSHEQAPTVAPWLKSELTEQEYLGFVHSDDYDEVKEMIEAYHAGKITRKKMEFRVLVVRDGAKLDEWVEIHSMATELSEVGKAKQVMGSMIIITERKRKEQELREANERALESDRMKSAFLASISHEIRTPLNAISGFSQLLTETKSPALRKKYCSIIQLNNEMLLSLIGDVIDLAKIESNSLDLNMKPVDLNQLLTDLRETILVKVENGVMVNVTLGEDECWIETDASRLTQILQNLLNNAVKFTKKGSITFGYELLDDEVEFYVKDTGIGIKAENQEIIFERFKKLDTFVQGSGLGLSICKEFVENMGGEISVKSRGLGKGSTFTFTLPYKEIDPIQGRLGETLNGAYLQDRDPLAHLQTIMVIENNDQEYRKLETALSHRYTLVRANELEDVAVPFNKFSPKLVLVDLESPNDGEEINIIRQIHKISPTVPVIAMSHIAFALDKQHLLSTGYTGCINKPFDSDELQDLLANILSSLSHAV